MTCILPFTMLRDKPAQSFGRIVKTSGRGKVTARVTGLECHIWEFCPLPFSIRVIMRWLSISTGFRWTASDIRSPAA